MRLFHPFRRFMVTLAISGVALACADMAAAADSRSKLPRFASVRAAEVNVRTGPGVRYPVEWVFVYRNMPVEIVAEFDTWRKVRDWDGTEGWVHRSMLSGRRSVIVTGGRHALRRISEAKSRIVARVDERVVGKLITCKETWCRLEIAGRRGWMRRNYLWGVYKDEKLK
jgi:SH3-like domain-containing protein